MDSILLFGLTGYAWITIATIVSLFTILLTTKLPADLVFLSAMLVLILTGVLTLAEAFDGFSANSVVTIGFLYVVIAGLIHTGVLQWIVRHVLGTPTSYNKAIIHLMAPVALLSSIMSNTAVVALFINVAKVWSKKINIAPSRLLIPLSYASCFGGVCTLIGTPPNMIISDLYAKDTGTQLGFFTLTLPGLFCLAVGTATVLALKKLLPDRKSADSAFEETAEYTAELVVPADSFTIGKSVAEASLQHVKGGRLIEIVRFDKEIITPVPDDEFIMGGDRLIFSGDVEEILQLKSSHQLVSAVQPVFTTNEIEKGRKLYTANIASGSPLIGNRIGASDFEQRHNAVLVAVSREGERLQASPHDILLERGDVLLFDASPRFAPGSVSNSYRLRFFTSDTIPNIGRKTVVSSLIMLAMILLSSFKILPLVESCFLAAFAMIVTRCCNIEQARSAIDWPVLMLFASSICLGCAIQRCGIAEAISHELLSVCGTDPLVILICICVLGTFLTEFVSNTACAAILYPIAYQSAVTLGANPTTFCVALMIAVSSSFATPIGSPTHMMIYGVGGYRFSDYARIGLPMNCIILAANLFIVTLLFPL